MQFLNPHTAAVNMPTKPWQELHQAVSETHPQRILLPHKVFWWYTLFSRTNYFCKRIWWWRCCTNIYRHTWKEYQGNLIKFKFPKSMIMTMHDKTAYDNSTLWHIYNEELGKDRVHDHCHLPGKFRGAAHEICILKCKVPKFFPVVFHNLSGYNSHLFFKTLGNSEGDISCIPNNQETRFISRNRLFLTNVWMRKEKRSM